MMGFLNWLNEVRRHRVTLIQQFVSELCAGDFRYEISNLFVFPSMRYLPFEDISKSSFSRTDKAAIEVSTLNRKLILSHKLGVYPLEKKKN